MGHCWLTDVPAQAERDGGGVFEHLGVVSAEVGPDLFSGNDAGVVNASEFMVFKSVYALSIEARGLQVQGVFGGK